MKRVLSVITLLLIAAAVLLWRLPASVLRLALPPELARVVQLHRLDGTVWHGSTLVTVSSVPPALPLAWTCRPVLWPLGVTCELRDAVGGNVTLNAVSQEVIAERITASVPLRVATGNQVIAQTPRVTASLAAATIARDRVLLKGNLRANDAAYRFGNADLQLGEVSLDCMAAPEVRGGSVCTIANRGGAARLDGRLQVSSRAVTGSIELTPAGGVTQRIGF